MGFPGLDRLDIEALMKLQYEFPLTATPYSDVASSLGVSVDELLSRLSALKERGIVKRVGFYLNYKSYRHVAALVALHVDEEEEASRLMAEKLTVTHSYVRNHPYYNLWVVVRAASRADISSAVSSIASRLGADYVILWSKKVYRLSVKYDLYKGISRAGPYSEVAEAPPPVEKFGVTMELARALRSLPIVVRPYSAICSRFGCRERELVEKAKSMLASGALGDPGAALNGAALGFNYNAMVVMEASRSYESLCSWVVDNMPEATHVVLRAPSPPGKWRHNCYAMIHAVDEARAGDAIKRIAESPEVADYMVIVSLRDLLPGVVR